MHILLVDDEEGLRKLLSRIVRLEGYVVEEASTLNTAWEQLNRKSFDIILCDVKLPDGNGVDFVKQVKLSFPAIRIILLTAYGNIPDGVQAVKNGAFDYITKGNDNDRIIPLLSQAAESIKLSRTKAVKIETQGEDSFASVIGTSRPILEAIKLAQKIAPTQTTVLLLGETGTGKEVFAKAIHQESKRRGKPFVALNCSAFTRELLEGELFGHKAGAYTGALRDKKGLIEMAQGGTLFLDEIGELHIDLQAKLLRVLEQGEFIKLGDTRISNTDVRIIAATNRNLTQQVVSGAFREDLLYRLNTFSITLPPLRERLEDIFSLAENFLLVYRERENKRNLTFSKEVLDMFLGNPWKGNIRELRNVIERAVILAEDQIQLTDLPPELQQIRLHDALSLAASEKMHIQKILKYTGNNKTKAAQILDIGVATLYRKIDEYGLQK